MACGGEAAAAALEAKLAEAAARDTWCWIIDPVDGTTNLAYAMPLCELGMWRVGLAHHY